MLITTEPPGSRNPEGRSTSWGSRLAWFALIWGASVVSVAVFAFLLKWLVFTPAARPH